MLQLLVLRDGVAGIGQGGAAAPSPVSAATMRVAATSACRSCEGRALRVLVGE
ncbi:MAG: hypothetical protein U0R64_06565 [Candidatus Nanopelagicales bacterium]